MLIKSDKEKINLKIKKALGQLNRVLQMQENDSYCIDIIHQNRAVIGFLESVQQDLIEHHLHHCFCKAAGNVKKRNQMIDELVKVLKYYNK